MKPDERDQIQVIGRLVQHEEIRFHHQKPRQMGAHDPSPAQVFCRPVKLVDVVTEPHEHFFGFCIHLRIAERLVLGMRLQIFRPVDGSRFFKFPKSRLKRRHLPRPSRGDI